MAMAPDELATEILDVLQPGAKPYADLLQVWPTEPATYVADIFQALVDAGYVDRHRTEPSTAWVTASGRDLLTKAHQAGAMAAAAIKTAVISRAIRNGR